MKGTYDNYILYPNTCLAIFVEAQDVKWQDMSILSAIKKIDITKLAVLSVNKIFGILSNDDDEKCKQFYINNHKTLLRLSNTVGKFQKCKYEKKVFLGN